MTTEHRCQIHNCQRIAARQRVCLACDLRFASCSKHEPAMNRIFALHVECRFCCAPAPSPETTQVELRL